MHPVLALALLATAGLLATRLPRLALPPHPSLHLDVAIVAGAPLVLVGLLLGPGIELVSRPLLRALAPVIALAIGCIGAVLGARCEWRVLRRIPRGAWALAAVSASAVFLVVALSAWLLARWVPLLGVAWAPRLPTVLGLAAVAAVSAPRTVTRLARAAGIRRTVARAFARAAALETACGALAMTVPLVLSRPHPAAGNPAFAWLAWSVLVGAGGALVSLVFLALTRVLPAPEHLGLELLGTLLFGAGIGYATGLSPFVVCALAAAAIVNASPRRRQVQALLAAWEQPGYALLLILVGALLTLPTLWILVAVPLLAALRAGARWASVRYAREPLKLGALPPHAGLATVAQGGAAVALGINYFLMLGSWPGSSSSVAAEGAGSPAGTAGVVLTTMVLGVAVAQLAAPPLLGLVLRPTPAPLTPAPASPEFTTNAPAD